MQFENGPMAFNNSEDEETVDPLPDNSKDSLPGHSKGSLPGNEKKIEKGKN